MADPPRRRFDGIDDDQLINEMLAPGPHSQSALGEMMLRLKRQLAESARQEENRAAKLTVLTWVLVVLTVVIALFTVVLAGDALGWF